MTISDPVAAVVEHLAKATTEHNAAQNALDNATTASTASTAAKSDEQLAAAADLARANRDRTRQVMVYREKQFNRLLNPNWYDRIDWSAVVQYAIFATLALIVLCNVMHGINSRPPDGTTPRGMITFLVAVVTAGIAMILVLATIVSDSPEWEKRFSRGKEVFTALLGVLGVIVGFYFGTSQDVQVPGAKAPAVTTPAAPTPAVPTPGAPTELPKG